ncbi:hypothetical protein [Streptomyces globisporus]
MLGEAGAHEQDVVLAERAVANVTLDDPLAVAQLLKALREARAEKQVRVLLNRDPATHVTLDDPDPFAVPWLLKVLGEAGADEQVVVLAERLPAVGKFELSSHLEKTMSSFDSDVSPTGVPPYRGRGTKSNEFEACPSVHEVVGANRF